MGSLFADSEVLGLVGEMEAGGARRSRGFNIQSRGEYSPLGCIVIFPVHVHLPPRLLLKHVTLFPELLGVLFFNF